MNEIKVNISLDAYNGEVKFNLLDLINSLDSETKQELVSDAGWWSFIEEDMAEKIVGEFSRENFNVAYTRLREKILTSEAMPKVIVEWAESVLGSLGYQTESARYWEQAYQELAEKVRVSFNNNYEMYSQLIPALPKKCYGRDYSPELMAEVKAKAKEWGALFDGEVKE